MKHLPLTQGKIAFVDEADYEKLHQFKWFAHRNGQRWYARRKTSIIKGKQVTILMHRVITHVPQGMEVDHINGNGLDNQKNNLRICTRQQNQFNRLKPNKNNKLGIKGVQWDKKNEKFRARIMINGKRIHLGYFNVSRDAAIAHRLAELEYFGKFARNAI